MNTKSTKISASPWDCLEVIPDATAPSEVWREHLGQYFEAFRTGFLVSDTDHESPGASALPAAGDRPLRLSWPKLANGLGRALGMHSRMIDLPIRGTRQVGWWSIDVVPVILTIQSESLMFRHVICELGLRLRSPFILLGPTSSHMDAVCRELLTHARSQYFALSSHIVLTEQGTLRALQSAGELFQQFTPQPRENLDEDTTRKAFALVKALDSRRAMKNPTPAAVFSFYCIDGLSISAIARKCQCSRGTIINRLGYIRKRTGADPNAVRQLSATLEHSTPALTDPRARCIHRRSLMDEPDEFEGDQE